MKLPVLFNDPSALKSVSAGTVLFKCGDPGDYMYIIKSGEIDIEINGEIVETAGPESIVGEMALLDEAPRLGTATVKTDAVVLPISQSQFIFMLEETPFFAIEVMRIMSARLRRRNNH